LRGECELVEKVASTTCETQTASKSIAEFEQQTDPEPIKETISIDSQTNFVETKSMLVEAVASMIESAI